MSSWVRYCVAMYLGLLLAGSLTHTGTPAVATNADAMILPISEELAWIENEFKPESRIERFDQDSHR